MPRWAIRSARASATLFLLFGVWHVYVTLGGRMAGADQAGQQVRDTAQNTVLWIIDIAWAAAAVVPLLVVARTATSGMRGRLSSWTAMTFACGLTGYGILTTCLSFLVVTDRVTANDSPDLHYNYLWGLFLFGPWFMALGITLGIASAGAITSRRRLQHPTHQSEHVL